MCNHTGFLHTSILDLHMQYIHSQSVFKCPKCNSRFQSANSLRVHLVLKHQNLFEDPPRQLPQTLPTLPILPTNISSSVNAASSSQYPPKKLNRQLPIMKIKHVASIASYENRSMKLPMVKVIHPANLTFPTRKKLEETSQKVVSRIKKKITPRRDELHNWTENSEVNLLNNHKTEIEKQEEIIIDDSEYSLTSSDDTTVESDDQMEDEKPIDEACNSSAVKIFVQSMPPIVIGTLPFVEKKFVTKAPSPTLPSLPVDKHHVKCLECHRSFRTILDLFSELPKIID